MPMFFDSEEFDLFKIKHNNVKPAKGKVLLSMPFLQESHFQKSVIILTEHTEEGSFGFILNKEVKYTLSDVLSEIPECDIPVSYGGPVENDTLHFIHTLGELIPHSVEVAKGLYWGGDIETIKALISSGKVTKNDIRFFIGYAGWAPNQLSDEILADTWLVSELDNEMIFQTNDEALWKSAMEKLGKKYGYWTNFPNNPNLN